MANIKDFLPPPPWELFKEEFSPEERRESESRIKAAKEIIAELQPLRPRLQAIYDKVKYGVSGGYWQGPRGIAADLANGLGDLENALSEVIRKERARRPRE